LIADILLREEGLHIHTDEEKMTHALLRIAKYECTVEDIEEWLRKLCAHHRWTNRFISS